MIIHIDAGHGGKDNGAVGNGLKEKDITLSLTKRVRTILENEYDNITVKMSRTTDVYLELSKRAELANMENAEYFLSIHVNAGGGTGYEDYIYNQSSTGGSTDISRTKLHNTVLSVLKKYGICDRGKKKANYAVLRETKMQAALVETLFIDTVADANLLKNNKFLDDIAQAYADGVAGIVGAKRTTKTKSEEKLSVQPKYYVQIGAFENRKKAESLLEKAKKIGFDPFIKMK